MNKKDKANITAAATSICRMYRDVSTPNPWENAERKQGLYDAITAMKKHGLIKKCNMVTCEVTSC